MHKRWIAQKKFLTHCLPPSKQLLCNQSKTHNKMKDKGEKSIISPENHSVSFFIGRETKKLNKMLVTLTAMNIHRQTLEKLLTLETFSSRDPIRRIAMWFFQRQFDLKWIYRAHFKLIVKAAAHWRTILKEKYLPIQGLSWEFETAGTIH